MRSLTNKFLGFLCLCLFLIPFATGCGLFGLPAGAQQGGGLTAPTAQSQFGSKNIVNAAPALTQEIVGACNGQALINYGWLMQLCGGQITLSALPVQLSATVNAVTAMGQKAWCRANMWTAASGQLSIPLDTAGNPIVPVLGNCPNFVAPAPVSAPSGASATPAKS